MQRGHPLGAGCARTVPQHYRAAASLPGTIDNIFQQYIGFGAHVRLQCVRHAWFRGCAQSHSEWRAGLAHNRYQCLTASDLDSLVSCFSCSWRMLTPASQQLLTPCSAAVCVNRLAQFCVPKMQQAPLGARGESTRSRWCRVHVWLCYTS
jgi:hypothetical protein